MKGTWKEHIDNPEQFERRKTLVLNTKGVAAPVRQKKINVDRLHHPEKYVIVSELFPVIIPCK